MSRFFHINSAGAGIIAMDMVSYCPYELIDTSSEDAIFRELAKRDL